MESNKSTVYFFKKSKKALIIVNISKDLMKMPCAEIGDQSDRY